MADDKAERSGHQIGHKIFLWLPWSKKHKLQIHGPRGSMIMVQTGEESTNVICVCVCVCVCVSGEIRNTGKD